MKYNKQCFKKLKLAVIMVAICVLCVSSTVSAVGQISDHRMTGGIGNIYIYIDDKQPLKATYWQNLIKTGVNNWMYTGVGANKFYCQGYVSSGTSGSKIDFYARPSNWFGISANQTMAYTSYWDYSMNQVDPKVSDWYSAQIDINDPFLRQDSISNDTAIALFIHEMGHAFGLDEEYDTTYSIMYPFVGAQVFRVQKIDNDALNRLY